MKRLSGLVVIGATLVLAPVLTHAISSAHDKERIAEFFRRNPNNAVLPAALEPSGFAGYHWACFGIGVSLLFAGIRESKLAGATKPEAWSHAEI